MVSNRDFKKYLSEFYFKDSEGKILVFAPITKTWRYKNNYPCNRYIPLFLNNQNLVFDTFNSKWYNSEMALLPKKEQQKIYSNSLRELILNSDISMVWPKRKKQKFASEIIKRMHHWE